MKKKFGLFSRIHPLQGYFPSWMENIYLKREDELFFHSFGSKARKIFTLKKFLLNQEYECIYVVGSRRSYNLSGIISLLHSERIYFKVITNVVRDDTKSTFSQKIIDSLPTDYIIESESLESHYCEALAKENAEQNGIDNYLFIPEGGSIKELLKGPEKIGKEILRFEKQNEIFFSKICISSGSGHTAIAIIHAFIKEKQATEREFIITLVAGQEAHFKELFKHLTDLDLEEQAISILFLVPPISPKFGKITPEIKEEVRTIFAETGILADPVYEAKHWMALKNQFQDYLEDPNILIIHNSNLISVTENY